MGKYEPSSVRLREIRTLFDPGIPFTADEAAEGVDCSRAAVREKLDGLADAGVLETKRIGDTDRIWWQPVENSSLRAGERTSLAHAQFEELTDAVTDYAIFVLDSDGHIQSWNEGAERMKGYEEAEVLGERLSIFYTDEAREADVPDANLEAAVEAGRTEDEGWRVRKDGSRFWANVVITPLHDDDDGLQGFIKVTRDMTERHEYEQQLETQNERLQQQNDRLESFASMLAHELRNPLTIAQIYHQQAVTGDPDAAAEVENALDRIEDMIDVLLIMARGAESVINREPVTLADIAEEAWADVASDDGELVVETDLTIETDPVHLQHLLENLFTNAIEHSDADVTVRVGDLSTGFYVADDGPGIPEAKREQVFDAGYTTDDVGIGLGLTFITQLADTYDWELTITESAEGGARFEFTDVGPDGEDGKRN